MLKDITKETNLHLDSSIDWAVGSEGDMRFTLVYKGPLTTRPTVEEKQEIRRQFHPQLIELWKTRLKHRFASVSFHEMPLGIPSVRKSITQLAEDYAVKGYGFVPLVTEELMVGCKLDIFFLSKGQQQRIVSNADLDNRLKGLFDGLRVPTAPVELPQSWSPTEYETPFFCLLKNDSLITDLKISGDTLLDPTVMDEDHYHLFIRVKIRPFQLTILNADLA